MATPNSCNPHLKPSPNLKQDVQHMQQGEGYHETLPEMWLVSLYSMYTEWNISWSTWFPEHESSLQNFSDSWNKPCSKRLIELNAVTQPLNPFLPARIHSGIMQTTKLHQETALGAHPTPAPAEPDDKPISCNDKTVFQRLGMTQSFKGTSWSLSIFGRLRWSALSLSFLIIKWENMRKDMLIPG